MLECARVLGKGQAKVGFVAFNAEEDGLLGSQDFVRSGLEALPCTVSSVHVLEMVGYRPRPPSGITRRVNAKERQTLPFRGFPIASRRRTFWGSSPRARPIA